MSKENQPLEYERRIEETKSLAQRLDLYYVSRWHWLRGWKSRLSWILALAAALLSIPLVLGVGRTRKTFVNGPMSRPHAILEQRCELCHKVAFTKVRDADCKTCHDGPAHHSNSIGEARCAACHTEHDGTRILQSMDDGQCTRCHANLSEHGRNIKTPALRITGFGRDRHPEFPVAQLRDLRPLRLNHAAHLPQQAKVIRGIKLPMKCGDCHQLDLRDRGGRFVPITFERHCASCHKRELEFDVYNVLAPVSDPAPHNKDPRALRALVAARYSRALNENPALARKPLRPDVAPPPTPALWLDMVIRDSEKFLFDRKCRYCHEVEAREEGLPRVARVNPVSGHFAAASVTPEPWLPKSVFNHRAHRMVECASCHSSARTSKASTDVLIPKMETCLPCHGQSAAGLDRCAQCHVYHDKSKDLQRDRLSIEELTLSRHAEGAGVAAIARVHAAR